MFTSYLFPSMLQKAYNMTSLSPESFLDLWKRLKASSESDPLFLLYNKHWYKGRTDVVNSHWQIVCELVNTTSVNPLCPPLTKAEGGYPQQQPRVLTNWPYMPEISRRSSPSALFEL